MGMTQVGPPVTNKDFYPRGKRTDLTPCAKRRRRGGDGRRSVEGKPDDALATGSSFATTHASDPSGTADARHLRLHDRTGTEGIAAMCRKAVVEDVQNAGHCAGLCQTSLNAASTPLG